MMAPLQPRRYGRQRGVALVELAFLLPLFVVLAFAMTELGRAMYEYDTLAKAARAAARYVAVNPSTDPTRIGQIRVEAANVAVCGNPSGCTSPTWPRLLPGLTTAMVDVQVPSTNAALRDVRTDSGAINLVFVTISPASNPYQFVSLMPFIIPNINFGPISVAMPQSFY